jgi:hypothetical protein
VDIPIETSIGLLKALLDWLRRVMGRRQRVQTEWRRERLSAYTRFVSAMDCASAVFQELVPLRQGLHWWNGPKRLKLMRATTLDKRLLEAGREVCESLEAVRSIGSARAVEAAEALLEVLTVPAARLDEGETVTQADFSDFSKRRRDLITIIRAEIGVEALQAA